MASHIFTPVKLTYDEKYAMDVATIALMNATPFYAHLLYSIGDLVPTRDLDTAATDGRHIFFNPDYFGKHKTPEQVFILAHELSHLVGRHPSRFKHYAKAGSLRGLPWVKEWANVVADYVINADLVDSKVGSCNPDWLYDPQIKAEELWEDVYERTLKTTMGGKPPKPPGQGSGGGSQAPGGGQGEISGVQPPSKVFRDSGKAVRGGKGDTAAAANGGGFDSILDPPIDAATSVEDLPDESEFKEAVARAYAVAKAMGKVPASVQRLVDELLTPQVDWRDHIRLLVTGKIGQRGETWTRPNRRRLALHPIVIMPGKKGFGAERVVVAVDTSGSIGPRELDGFFAEISGILSDCRPREIVVIGCDAAVSQVDHLHSLDEFQGLLAKGIKGGGGTDFRPVFNYVDEHQLKPETLVYLTDLFGSFPDEAPGYPVVWCATSDQDVPWGDVVRLKLEVD